MKTLMMIPAVALLLVAQSARAGDEGRIYDSKKLDAMCQYGSNQAKMQEEKNRDNAERATGHKQDGEAQDASSGV